MKNNEIKKYDKKGNLIYYKKFKFENWFAYDKSNNCVHCKDSYGFE